MRKLCSIVLALGLVFSVACAKAHAPVPGAVNQFDSDTYLSIATAKGAIDEAKKELEANAFPPNIAANVKAAVNAAVTSYNFADTVYQAYHTSALAGQDTPQQKQNVTTAVGDMNGKVQAVTSATGGK